MPTPIAHVITGVAIAWSAERLRARPLRTTSRLPAVAIWCGVLAMVPDLDLLYRSSHRTMTHSLSATVLVALVAALAIRWSTGKVRWPVPLVCGAAYGSHLLLDWLARDTKMPPGIQLFWPFSDQWFISDWTLFRAAELHRFFSPRTILWNAQTLAWELLILAPIVLAFWFAANRRRLRASDESSGGDPHVGRPACTPTPRGITIARSTTPQDV